MVNPAFSSTPAALMRAVYATFRGSCCQYSGLKISIEHTPSKPIVRNCRRIASESEAQRAHLVRQLLQRPFLV